MEGEGGWWGGGGASQDPEGADIQEEEVFALSIWFQLPTLIMLAKQLQHKDVFSGVPQGEVQGRLRFQEKKSLIKAWKCAYPAHDH